MSLENDPQFQAEAKAEQQFIDRINNRKMLENFSREEMVEMILDSLEYIKNAKETMTRIEKVLLRRLRPTKRHTESTSRV